MSFPSPLGVGIILMAAATMLGAIIPDRDSKSPTACANRRKTKAPYCDSDEQCVWVDGACRDRDPLRYFTAPLSEGQAKFCRCSLHLMAKGVPRAHKVCARSTGTSTGGKPCFYDWEAIPTNEVVGYAKLLQQRGVDVKPTRDALKEWYEGKKKTR
jgi:hypothetical protein